MKDCCFCKNLVAEDSRQKWDEPLFSSPNFIAVPSLGSIVEGWLLILPKKHFLSIGGMPEALTNELMQFKRQVAKSLILKYGDICAFEHGPSNVNKKIGCGVDHAHLHLLPIGFDLITAAQPYLPDNLRWTTGNFRECRSAFYQGYDYLYVEQPLDQGRIAVHSQFESQIFRKAIAGQFGIPNRYNWRLYPHNQNLSRTIENLSAPSSL